MGAFFLVMDRGILVDYFLQLYNLPSDKLSKLGDDEADFLLGFLDGLLEEYDLVVDRLTNHRLKRHMHSDIPYDSPLQEERSKLRESIEPVTGKVYWNLIDRRDFIRVKVNR